MTMLRVFVDGLSDPESIVKLAESASAPIAVTVLNVSMLRRAGLLIADDSVRARYLAPHLSGYGDFSLFLDDILAERWECDVYALLKQAKADELRAVWTIEDYPGPLLFRNRYCDRLTLGYVNAAPLEDLLNLKWAGVKENIGTIRVPQPSEVSHS